MTVAIVRHFENMRTLLKAYNDINANPSNPSWPFDSSYIISPPVGSDTQRNYILSLFRVPQAQEAGKILD